MYNIKALMVAAIAVCILILGGLYYSDRISQSTYATWAQEQNKILNESQRAEEAENARKARSDKADEQETKADETSPADGEDDAEETQAAQALKYTTTAGVNVRDTASSAGEKLGVLEKGTVLKDAREEGEWIRFRYEGRNGYVSARFVSVGE